MKEREEYVLDYCGVSFYYVLEFLRDEESGKQLIQVIRDQVLLKSISLMAEISGLVDLSDAIEIRLHRIDLERTLGWVYGLTVGLMGIVKFFIELVCRIFVFEVRNEVSDVSSELRAESNCKGSKRSKEMNDTEIDPRDESKSNLDTQNRNLVKSLNKNVDRILGMESVHFLVSFTLLAVFGWILTQVFLA